MSKAAELAALIGSQTALSNMNIIINGAMNVAQRSTSVASLSSTATYSTCDRWQVQYGSSGTFTESQSTTAPSGFSNSLKFDCTTADASPNYLVLDQRIEGQNLQHLKKGTSSAASTTLSFYVRSSKTGTYQVNLRDLDNDRMIGATYTISSANTWEFKSITFAGDTTGAFDDDNASSLGVEWWLAAGSTYNSGAVPTAWETTANGDRAAGLNVAIGASTSDDFHITGVQLEVGEQATPFEHRSFGDELARCQRYYQVTAKATSNYHVFPAQRFSSTKAFFSVPIATSMRADPTLSSNTTDNIGLVGGNGSTTNFALSAVSFTNLDASSITLNVTVDFTPSTGRGMTGYITTGDELQFDAEL